MTLVLSFFKGKDTVVGQGISLFIGKYHHVECMITDNETSNTDKMMTFAAYEGSPYFMYETQLPSDPSTRHISYPITATEAFALKRMNFELASKPLPYNYTDSHFVMPFWGSIPLFTDVTSETMKKGFCSQISVIIMRECMMDTMLTDVLHSLNSRLTSPNALYRLLKSYRKAAKPIGFKLTTDEFTDMVKLGIRAKNATSFQV
jgi:hypothetical protein